jgi:aspartate/methionine/tyrosine aminotransferase
MSKGSQPSGSETTMRESAHLQGRSRMDAVQAPIVPIVGDLIRDTPGTISLGQGVVHYGPPASVLEAVQTALREPATHQYHDGNGLPLLVDRIRAKLAAENGIVVPPSDSGAGDPEASRVMVTAGANMAFMHAVLAATMPGDEVILPVPFYFNHEMAVEMAACRVVGVPTDDRYQLRVDAIAAAMTPRTRMVVTISPNNPTGAVYSAASLRELNQLCGERGIYHFSDEPYEYFTYGGARHVSPGSFPGAAAHTISAYSLSKAYGFAGWRIGYMVYPAHLASALMKSQDTILICPPVASQVAAAQALAVGRPHCEPYVRELASIREIVVRELNALAPLAHVPSADGAFYVLLNVRTDLDPMLLAERLIREHKVAVIPGPAFGMTEGCAFRVAYGALQKETVAEGVGRLATGLRAILS